MKIFLMSLLLVLYASSSFAGLKITGSGDSTQVDSSGFPPAMKASYDLMKTKCAKCHSLERIIVSVKNGVAPVSGQPFDKSATKAYGIKMMRKPDANMTKDEVKSVIELLNYLIDEAAK